MKAEAVKVIIEDTGKTSVSAIIVNYNAGPLLRGCVDSLLACPLAVEVIVVDNASHDASLDGLPDDFLIGVVGKHHHRAGLMLVHDHQLFKNVAARRVAVDQDCVRLHRLDILRQMHASIHFGNDIDAGVFQRAAQTAEPVVGVVH